LREPSYGERAADVGRRIRQENGPARAADSIEQVLLGTTRNQSEELAYASGD